jgi:hypothetical protein
MAILSSQDVSIGNSSFVSHAVGQYDLGTRGYSRDGRAFRYVLNGGVALATGDVIQSAAPPAGQFARAVNTTSAVGAAAVAIAITCGSSVAAGFYNDGYLVIASGTGLGFVYQIRSHPAVSTGATGVFTLYDEDGLAVAITISSTVTLMPNKYAGVIQMPVTTPTGVVVGVAAYPIAITQYGWLQTWGPCACNGGDTGAIGTPQLAIGSTAGRITSATAASLITGAGQLVGNLMQAGILGQYVLVDLKIAP